jgi:hypothetical protein
VNARGKLVVVVVAFAMSACSITLGSDTGGPRSPDPSPSPVPTGKGSAAAAMRQLCEAPKGSGDPGVTPEGPTPPAIATVERQVESVRELRYTSRVDAQAITQQQIDRRLTRNFDKTEPVGQLARRSQAWATIGVIPPGTSIRDAMLEFQTGQVVGFYNPANKKLVYIGDQELSLNERFILAHELTHAIDDQHFGLSRLDPLVARCEDEAFTAALGAVEGSAQFFATQVITRFPQSASVGGNGTAGSLDGVPPFIVNQALWPYRAGLAFIQRLDEQGGTARVNRALTDFPVSTEQIIHPERWPNDTPQPLDIPDLGPALGSGWDDSDVMEVGELWLQQLLELRLEQSQADGASTGWDGGIYRAWSNGSKTAIVLRTVWDTADDAQEFADAMRTWVGDETAIVRDPVGTQVDVLFASDDATLAALSGASI